MSASWRPAGGLLLAAMVLGNASSASAQTLPADRIAELRQQLEALKAEQAATSAKIGQIATILDQIEGKPASSPAPAVAAASPPAAPAAAAKAAAPSRLQLSGDVRVRYETNRGDADGRIRDRGVARGRLRAAYAIDKNLSIGGQLSTGDPDDPNTADITLSNWDDDLLVSLDQLYIKGVFGNLTLIAGKIPQPFRRTDLVWDGDVSPQGLSAAYRLPFAGGAALRATGLYFQVDEAAGGPDSSMIGGQLEIASQPGPTHFELAAGYYDYRLNSLTGADAGDWRTNRLLATGRYASDFNILDVVGSATFGMLGERWPIQLIGNYAHNFGAQVDGDTAFGADLYLGRTSKPRDWRFGYGYAQAEVDSVLAAFSHDNLDFGTNYRLHTISLDYVPRTNMLLNLTWYHYQPLDARWSGLQDPNDWLERVRMNFSVNF
ncbi:putative porin [Novosphingobium kunmingense]|nr:putative porin [Novosphingobium kunmingense]